MAITFDSAAYLYSSTAPGTLTFSMTCNADSTLLLVSIGKRTIAMTVASITFNGVALTQAVVINGLDFNQAEIWYLINPDITTANVVITLNAGTFVQDIGTAVSLKGTDTTSPIEATASNDTSGATTLSLSGLLSTSTDGAAVMDCIHANGGQTLMTAETNRVVRGSINPSSIDNCSTIITKSPAGGVTLEWTMGGASAAMCGVVIKPAAAASGGGPLLSGGPLTKGSLIRGGRLVG